jgi:hypothetical protein
MMTKQAATTTTSKLRYIDVCVTSAGVSTLKMPLSKRNESKTEEREKNKKRSQRGS